MRKPKFVDPAMKRIIENDDVLIPELIKGIAKNALGSDSQNAMINQKRIEVIRNYCNEVIEYLKRH